MLTICQAALGAEGFWYLATILFQSVVSGRDSLSGDWCASLIISVVIIRLKGEARQYLESVVPIPSGYERDLPSGISNPSEDITRITWRFQTRQHKAGTLEIAVAAGKLRRLLEEMAKDRSIELPDRDLWPPTLKRERSGRKKG